MFVRRKKIYLGNDTDIKELDGESIRNNITIINQNIDNIFFLS